MLISSDMAVSSGIAQMKALKQALTSIQSQLDSTILGQKVGLRTEVDVLNVQQSFYSARRDLARAHYSLLMAKLRLEAEAGNWMKMTQPKLILCCASKQRGCSPLAFTRKITVLIRITLPIHDQPTH